MVASIIEMFKTQALYLFLGSAAYILASLALIMISTKVNVFGLKESFDRKRFVNGFIEAILDASSMFVYLLAVIMLVVVTGEAGILKDGIAEQFGVVAMLYVLGSGTIKTLIAYQAKQKEEIGVVDDPTLNSTPTSNDVKETIQ
jgi:hypothetical protein